MLGAVDRLPLVSAQPSTVALYLQEEYDYTGFLSTVISAITVLRMAALDEPPAAGNGR